MNSQEFPFQCQVNFTSFFLRGILNFIQAVFLGRDANIN